MLLDRPGVERVDVGVAHRPRERAAVAERAKAPGRLALPRRHVREEIAVRPSGRGPAPHAVATEMAHALAQPAPFDVDGGHDRSASAELSRHERLAWRRIRMQPVPALDLEGFVAELLIRRRAPHVGRDVVLLEELLRAQGLAEDRAGAEERRPQLPAL